MTYITKDMIERGARYLTRHTHWVLLTPEQRTYQLAIATGVLSAALEDMFVAKLPEPSGWHCGSPYWDTAVTRVFDDEVPSGSAEEYGLALIAADRAARRKAESND